MIQDSGFMNDEKPISRIKEFTDLISWQEAHKLVIQIYEITKKSIVNCERHKIYRCYILYLCNGSN